MLLDSEYLLLHTYVCHEVPPGDPIHPASSFASFHVREQHIRCRHRRLETGKNSWRAADEIPSPLIQSEWTDHITRDILR